MESGRQGHRQHVAPEKRSPQNLNDPEGFNWSGRQDSNLRPLGPEGASVISNESIGVQPLAFVHGRDAPCDAFARSGRSGTLGRVTPVGPTRRRTDRLGAAPPALLTVREAAQRLSVSTATIYALCDRGQLQNVRVSNAIRLRVEDLEEFTRRGRP